MIQSKTVWNNCIIAWWSIDSSLIWKRIWTSDYSAVPPIWMLTCNNNATFDWQISNFLLKSVWTGAFNKNINQNKSWGPFLLLISKLYWKVLTSKTFTVFLFCQNLWKTFHGDLECLQMCHTIHSKNCGVKITPPVLIKDHTMHFTPVLNLWC